MPEQLSELLTPSIRKTIRAAQCKELIQPMLLLLAGHRPLAFIAGQLLHLGSPFGALCGLSMLNDWAELLSHPEGPSILERELNVRTYAVETQS